MNLAPPLPSAGTEFQAGGGWGGVGRAGWILAPPPPQPQEEEIPELEIDVDELLDMESDDTRAARVKVRGAGGQQGQVRGAGAKGLQGGGLPIVGSASLWRQAFLDLRQSAL